jgi:RNA polymerase sigma factor (sigma-70 family)
MKLWLSLRNPFSRPGSGRDVVPADNDAAGDEVANSDLGNSDLAMGPAAGAEASDDELLRKFVVERDDRAFGLLVERHSGMVMGVCRRVLGIQHDAEDAFQAVFLQLARKANTLRCGGSLPAWLHKTAFRTALRARAERGRRREQPTEDLQMLAEPELRNVTLEHDRSIVDEELNALPERYRLPLYLCCIEGKTLEVAARQLGWSLGSVKGRLERGRAELRRRLLLRRVAPTFGFLLLAGLAPAAKAAAVQSATGLATLQATTYVSPSLIAATVQAGMQQAAGRSALGYVTQNALQLSKGSWKFMSLTTTKFVACSLAALGLAIGGGSYLPSPAGAVGTGQGVTLEASFAPSAADAADEEASALFSQLALADEGGAKTGPRDGDAPKTGPRDGDAPRTGPRDGAKEGDAPRTGAREGDAPRTGAREGAQPRTGGERPNPRNALQNFKPQTQREEMLFQALLQMQQEIAQLRQMVQQQGGRGLGEGGRLPARGEGAPKTGPRE